MYHLDAQTCKACVRFLHRSTHDAFVYMDQYILLLCLAPSPRMPGRAARSVARGISQPHPSRAAALVEGKALERGHFRPADDRRRAHTSRRSSAARLQRAATSSSGSTAIACRPVPRVREGARPRRTNTAFRGASIHCRSKINTRTRQRFLRIRLRSSTPESTASFLRYLRICRRPSRPPRACSRCGR